MLSRWMRLLTSGVAAFIAATAIGGGIAILIGIDEFPIAWLVGTPFETYTVPALILAIVVGGSALLAAISTLDDWRAWHIVAIAAGAIMVGFIIGEVRLLNQPAPVPTPIEVFYLTLGGLMVVMGLVDWFNRIEQQAA